MAILNTLYSGQGVSSSGGTITGDLTISGDLTVTGSGDMAYSEVITGDVQITQATVGGFGLKIIKTGYDRALYIDHGFNIGTGITAYGMHIDFDKTGATTGGTQYLYGAGININDPMASTSGVTVNTTGLYVGMDISGGVAKLGTHNNLAGHFSGGSVKIDGGSFTDATCDYEDGTTITMDGTGHIVVGMGVSGTGIPANAYVSAIASATTFTLSAATTGGAVTNGTLTFTQPGILTLANVTTDVDDTNILGQINFQAPLEGTGTDAVKVGASIKAVAEAAFAADVNSTALVFSTGTSETATEKMRLGSGANGSLDLQGSFFDLNLVGGESRIQYKTNAATFKNGIKFKSSQILFMFDTVTSYSMILDTNSRISLSNNDGNTSNTVFGKNAFVKDDQSILGDVGADFNVVIGEDAMGDADTLIATHNVAIGYAAMKVVISADYTTAVGANAGDAITSGGYNTLVGGEAGGGLIGGTNNVAIGAYAMASCDTGIGNVAIGLSSLNNAASDVDGAIVIGHNTGQGALTSGSDYSIFIGENAGYAVTSGGGVAIGYQSFKALTTGSGNTALGYQAGLSTIVDNDNTFIGREAASLMQGASNVAVGKDALKGSKFTDNTQGSDITSGTTITMDGANANILAGMGVSGTGLASGAYVASVASSSASPQEFVVSSRTGTVTGGSTLTFYSRGDDNVAIGLDALTAITTGGNNVAIGSGAGDTATIMSNSILIGSDAGTAITTSDGADGTIAIGHQSLKALATAGANTAIGWNAMLEHTGASNTVIGYAAMDKTGNVPTSSDNIFIGVNAGGGTWVSAVSNFNVGIGNGTMGGGMNGALHNLAVGYSSMSGLTEGARNTCIGGGTGGTITTGSNNTIIGNNGDVSASGADNQTIVGKGVTGVADNSVTLGNTDVTAVYMAQDSGAAVHCAKVNSGTATGTAVGGGFDGVVACDISVGNFNSEIVTTLYVDMEGDATNVASIATLDAIIGEGTTAAAYLTRITTAINGLVYRGEIICLEPVVGGNNDVNLASNSASLASQADVTDGNGQVLTDSGALTLAQKIDMTIPSGGIQDDYIYLSAGSAGAANNYTEGRLLIKFYGASITGL